MKRRLFLSSFLLLAFSKKVIASQIENIAELKSNFKYVYNNRVLKKRFYKFLVNVFNLFPENDFQNILENMTKKYSTDKNIYLETQKKLDDISPTFSALTYQLPALFKQKDEMARQTLELIGKKSKYKGYLEIGSSGRYLDYLEERVEITGNRYYADGKEPGYSVTEMIDRGQISIGAEYIPMADYKTKYSTLIDNNSLDLVTVYIGFHHCPLELRIPFISSIRDTMTVGGKLILRDHDCHNEDQETIVALAHDVFNLGTNESWTYNKKEVRNFYSLDFIIEFVEKIGFKFEKKTLFQKGDPTKNALMLFTKI